MSNSRENRTVAPLPLTGNRTKARSMADSAITFTSNEVSTYYAVRVPHLKQRPAAEWRGTCPIHHGKDDNFAVDPGTGRWFCHSRCGRGGDILNLEGELCGGDFPTRKTEVFRLVSRADPTSGVSPQERRMLANRRATLDELAGSIGLWRRGRVAELESPSVTHSPATTKRRWQHRRANCFSLRPRAWLWWPHTTRTPLRTRMPRHV